MQGTAVLTRSQFSAIAAEVERLDRTSGLAVTRLDITPSPTTPGTCRPVAVDFHILGYGKSRICFAEVGHVTEREHLLGDEPFAWREKAAS